MLVTMEIDFETAVMTPAHTRTMVSWRGNRWTGHVTETGVDEHGRPWMTVQLDRNLDEED